MRRLLKFVWIAALSGLLVVQGVAPLRVAATGSLGHRPYTEATAKVRVGQYYGRDEYLHPDAAQAFKRMRSAAAAAGINLDIISGYRSVSDQQALFSRQVSRLGSVQAAAQVSAPPGHSEHHTGYAVDIRDTDQPQSDLKVSFEQTRTFAWLEANASEYGFEMSFPAGNEQGVTYEPWHWRFIGTPEAAATFARPPPTVETVSAVPSPAASSAPSRSPSPAACSVPATVAEQIPNINGLSFSSMTMPESGEIFASGVLQEALKDQDASVQYSWSAGESLSSVLSLGDIEQLQPENLTLTQVEQRTGINIKELALSNFRLLGVQTVAGLADAVPGLPQMPVRALQPVADLINRAGKAALKSYLTKHADATLSQILGIEPALGNIPLNQLALQNFAIASIPGLSDTPLGNFSGWAGAKIADIPGLPQLPISAFPGGGCLLDPLTPIGIIDTVYGPNEAMATHRPITGSDVAGFRVACNQQNCAYLELRDPIGKEGPLHQARWIKGGKAAQGGQMVKGGQGVLGEAFGGQEPTGRMPFGPKSNLKLVLTDVNESSGRANFSVYMRVCKKGLGCTPFIFGPIPFMNVSEGGPVLVGLDGQASFGEPNLDVPDDVRRQIEQVSEAYGESSGVVDDCAKEVLKAVNSGYWSAAQQAVPLILKEAQKAGLTPNQTAYVLATAQHESGMGKFMHLMGDRSSWGRYYARGFVGLTHQFNYEKMSSVLGVDLLGNPDLAAQPEISARILVEGMKNGHFTGYKLSDFIDGSKVDFFNARAVINGAKDSASLYANEASNFQKALRSCATYGGSCGTGGPMARPSQGPITSEFGWRIHPIHGGSRLHAGTDIGAPHGAPIVAGDCGKVVTAGWEGGYGNTVVIQHRNGLYTRYAHQSSMKVKVGQGVGKGQVIGAIGSTGNSTGPHLHFEVRRGGPWGDPQNPRNYAAL